MRWRRSADSGISESDPYALRGLPNDDVFFYSKKIDNSRLVRQADPGASDECWSAVGAGALAADAGRQHRGAACGSGARRLSAGSAKAERQTLLDQGVNSKCAKPAC
jgi:hypothetical protein